MKVYNLALLFYKYCLCSTIELLYPSWPMDPSLNITRDQTADPSKLLYIKV